ncbi:MAG: DUF4214 domain-containing protein [Pirellulales bacterium]
MFHERTWLRRRKPARQSSAQAGAGRGYRPRIERLEDRLLLSVSAEEQHFVYLLNRARHDPVAYQLEAGLSVDLSGVAPRPPLAVNNDLFDSAEFHATEMATFNYFDHQSHVTGDWPNKMARDQGYVLPAFWSDTANFIESLAAGTFYSSADQPLDALIVDQGISPPGHREHLLGITSFDAENREIGVGHAFNAGATYRNYWAIHATRSDPADSFLTGVVFNDANGNGRYDVNEGLGQVTIVAGPYGTVTNDAGGWSIRAAAGTYTVTASGASFAGIASAVATVTGNVEVDFMSGQALGIVDFETLLPGAPTANADMYVLGGTGSNTAAIAEGLLTNDTDAQGDPLTAVLVTAPTRGTLSLAADGSFAYTPGSTFRGLDRFSYRAHDGIAGGNAALVTIVSYEASLVRKLYQQVLARDPEDSGLVYWTGRILAGDGYGRVAEGIFESNERLNPIIAQFYRDYLLREPDAAGLSWWRDQVWKRDGGPENVVAGMIGSAEFFQSAGGTSGLWVAELYRRLLGREPEPAGAQFWEDELNDGRRTREQVVLGFVQSDENFANLIAAWHQQYLGRLPSSSELTTLVGRMRDGASHRAIQIGLIDSVEYRGTPAPPPSGAARRL